jgi:hypothetical protein
LEAGETAYEKIRLLYSTPDILQETKSRGMRCVSHVACIGEKRVADKVSVGKHQGRRPLGRLGSTCKNRCKMDLREIGWECVRVAAYGNSGYLEHGNEPSCYKSMGSLFTR